MFNKKNKSGQAVLEMALVLPIFLIILIGIFDFGRALHCWSNLNYQCMKAVRAGTRRINPLIARSVFSSTTHPSLNEVQQAFWQFRSPLMPEDSFSNITFTGVGTSERTLEISASFNLSLYTPILGGLVGGNSKEGAITIQAVAREEKE